MEAVNLFLEESENFVQGRYEAGAFVDQQKSERRICWKLKGPRPSSSNPRPQKPPSSVPSHVNAKCLTLDAGQSRPSPQIAFFVSLTGPRVGVGKQKRKHIAGNVSSGTLDATVAMTCSLPREPQAHSTQGTSMSRPRVVIVGGGFAGLAAAKALRSAPAEVLLIDRTNHHLFQPLLYQVATSVLAPGQIAYPIRGICRSHKNTTVILGEVVNVEKDQKCVIVSDVDRQDVRLEYDYLVLATGASHSYFGHDEFAKYAPGLKTVTDAVAIRNTILGAFEQAEAEEDPSRHRDLLTFVLVGAGPTGMEMAGALAVLVRSTLKSEFRRIDPASARIVLVDVAPRVLPPFAEGLSRAAKKRLEKLGVEVRLGAGVDQIDADGVVIRGERIASKAVIWTAGVAPSPAAKWVNAETDRAGRARVLKDLTVQGHPEIFVIGDTASYEQDGKPLPGVAQVAMQQGRYVGRMIRGRIAGKPTQKPFRYFDKGTMAVVGKGFAVLQTGKVHISGFLAWLAWAGIHLQFLAQSSLRVSVFVQWIWTYLTGQRGSRIIVKHQGSDPSMSAASLRLDETVSSR
jgi:NADH:ubiquinone reductase (H+-translocating)